MCASSHTFGSCSLIHIAFGNNHSALMGPSPAEFTRSSGKASRMDCCGDDFSACEWAMVMILAAWLAERASIQRRHGRSGVYVEERATTEQQVVSQHSALTSYSKLPPLLPASSSSLLSVDNAPLTAAHKLSYQSSGCCSAHPAWGWVVSYGTAWDLPMIFPVWASKQQARMDSVPPSMPMTMSIVDLLLLVLAVGSSLLISVVVPC
mmetsp:Transcript_41978/g.76730  ORF Transcript_41978/g.76730 Transcript_41978/m.76730 type:complete len:207 (-) Transcript_41978:388-1008(-)